MTNKEENSILKVIINTFINYSFVYYISLHCFSKYKLLIIHFYIDLMIEQINKIAQILPDWISLFNSPMGGYHIKIKNRKT